MDQIIYVCVGVDRRYYGTFANRELAEGSWKLSYSRITDNVRFETYAGGWKVLVCDDYVGDILCEVVQGKVARL